MGKQKKFAFKFASDYQALRTGGRKADSSYFKLRIAHKKIAYVNFLIENVDQLVIVASLVYPKFRSGLIDRFLTLAHWSGREAIIILTKRDLVSADQLHAAQSIYGKLSYKLYAIANPPSKAKKDEDLELESLELESSEENSQVTLSDGGEHHSNERGSKPFLRIEKEVFLNKSSALVGHSGVGKTALLRRIDPGYTGRVNEVSAFTRRGRHTTTRVTRYELASGGEVFDMPGLKEMDFTDVTQRDLKSCYEEFASFAAHCAFKNCLHDHEPDCAVKAALSAGKIHPVRYRNYLQILSTLDS